MSRTEEAELGVAHCDADAIHGQEGRRLLRQLGERLLKERNHPGCQGTLKSWRCRATATTRTVFSTRTSSTHRSHPSKLPRKPTDTREDTDPDAELTRQRAAS